LRQGAPRRARHGRCGRRQPSRDRVLARRLDAFAGVAYERADLLRWFAGLGLEVVDGSGDTWKVRVPGWRRFDLERAEDLYEEAMRVRGFDAIPPALSAIYGSDGPETPVQRRRRLVRHHLVGQGIAETIQYALVSREEDARYPLARLESTGAIALAIRSRTGWR
jgi:phenylalanyl-tRNA synthetase beta chain